jgi:hypothetical protein
MAPNYAGATVPHWLEHEAGRWTLSLELALLGDAHPILRPEGNPPGTIIIITGSDDEEDPDA